MLLTFKRLIITCVVLAAASTSYVCQAATLTANLKKAIQESGSVTEIPIIIRFNNKLDATALRKEVDLSIQAKSLNSQDIKQLRKKHTRSIMLKRLRQNLVEPTSNFIELLESKGIQRKAKRLWNINALAVTIPSYLIDEIQKLNGVEQIDHDYRVRISASTSDLVTGIPLWNLSDINASSLWDYGFTGEGVVVGIMDTGVDLNHPDLIDNWRGGENSWFDPYEQYLTPTDPNGHGTQVTGLISGGDYSGYQIGVAPNAKWIAAKIFDDSGESTISSIHEAFQWMLDPDGDPTTDDAPDIINNSWGIENQINQCIQEFNDEISTFKEAGIAVVFSAGNFGPQTETSLSPANDPAVISVGSVNQSHDIENTSSRGPSACDGGIYPRLVAPGGGIYTSDRLPHEYNIVSGTSFASPHVTGALAQLISAFPDATVTQLESALTESAKDIEEFDADNNAGFGLLDVSAAYEWLIAEQNPTGAGIFLFSEPIYSIDETTAKLFVTVRRIGGSAGNVSIDYQTQDNEATSKSDADYFQKSGTLTFNDGETSRSIEITINDDSIDEPDEDFYVELFNPNGDAILGSRTIAPIIILDDDGPGSLAMESSSYAVNEKISIYDVTIFRTGGYAGRVTVEYITNDVTANSSSDYQLSEGTLVFEDGEKRKTISLEINNDDDYEPNESFNLRLLNPTGGANIIEPEYSSITILNDDVDPLKTVITIDSVSYVSSEDSTLEITIRRSGDLSNQASINYITTDGSATEGEDYEKADGTLTFLPGEITQSITLNIDILDDAIHEEIETFNFTLFNVSDGTELGNPSTSIIRIQDNDSLPFVSIGSAGSSIPSNTSDGINSQSSTSGSSIDSPDNKSSGSINDSYAVHELTLTGYIGTGEIYEEGVILDDSAHSLSVDDKDGDGFHQSVDCNDDNATIHPGATEIKNDGIDQNCSGFDLTQGDKKINHYNID